MNHYHLLDKSGRTIGSIPIGPPPMFTPYELCRNPLVFLSNDGKRWIGDRYDANGPMCVCATAIEKELIDGSST